MAQTAHARSRRKGLALLPAADMFSDGENAKTWTASQLWRNGLRYLCRDADRILHHKNPFAESWLSSGLWP